MEFDNLNIFLALSPSSRPTDAQGQNKLEELLYTYEASAQKYDTLHTMELNMSMRYSALPCSSITWGGIHLHPANANTPP